MIEKIDEDTRTITTTVIIDLKAIRTKITEYETLANEVKFIDYSKIKDLPKEIIEVLDKENSERNMIKADMLEQKRQKEQELESYG